MDQSSFHLDAVKGSAADQRDRNLFGSFVGKWSTKTMNNLGHVS
jgi:hypothetical protein